jgi:hypothetical protein
MNTLWTFGDSFTFGHGCRKDCNSYTVDDYYGYKKEGDDIWPNHLGNLLNCNVSNLGKNGVSNDYILDTIIDNFDFIKENDYIIIGKTFHGRIEVPFNNKIYKSFAHYEGGKIDENTDSNDIWLKNEFKDLNKEVIETIINFQYYFSNELFYKERNNKRFEFIKNRLHNEKNVKFCYIWGLEEDIKFYHTFEQIIQATNRKVIDTHFSFKGHLDFAHFIYNKINKKTL